LLKSGNESFAFVRASRVRKSDELDKQVEYSRQQWLQGSNWPPLPADEKIGAEMSLNLKSSEIIRLAIFAALLTSISEICLSLLFQWLGLFDWRWIWPLMPELAPIVPVLYVPLFCLLGLALLAASRVHPWFRSSQGVVCAFAMVFLYNLASFSGHLSTWLKSKTNMVGALAGIAIVAIAWAVSHAVDRNPSLVRHFCHSGLKWSCILTLVLVAVMPGWRWATEKLGSAQLPAVRQSAPNVLLIVVDTLRADHVSAYGYPRDTTPHLDQLAREGTLFEMAISSSSWTLPSHASILTGVSPREHGAEYQALDNRHLTVAEAFRSRGYRTSAFSANPFFFCRRMGLGRGFLHFSDIADQPTEWLYRTLFGKMLISYISSAGVPVPPLRRNATAINQAFLHWADAGPGIPFFAILNLFDVHSPYLPPDSYRRLFGTASPPDKIRTAWLKNYYAIRTKSGVRTWMDAYDGCIRYVDDQIDALFGQLRKRGLEANTLVVVASDHGEAFGDHGMVDHANSLYFETIHVPLIFYWPGVIPKARRIAQPVSMASLPATLLDLAGEKEDRRFETPSLGPLIKSGESMDTAPCSELTHFPYSFLIPGDPSLYGEMTSIVRNQWHYIAHEYAGEELYDWKQDPLETNDLAGLPESGQILASFRQTQCR
jgi:arylsulfatase A-like enzyme